ncbi:MAG TPA: S41 family peptidase, partial [Aquificae bacterium]|nr:S41 family peptidase [Aquificota bacterium]
VKVKGKAEYEVYKSQEPVFVPKHIPIVILVNQATASAAEIFTGSLKDYNRAIVVGEKTFGKGCVQNIFTLPYGYAVKLTTAYYYLPKGECIQGKGIKPDIEVKLSKKDKEFLKKLKEKEKENPEKILEYKKLRENYVDEQLKKAMEVLDKKLEEING